MKTYQMLRKIGFVESVKLSYRIARDASFRLMVIREQHDKTIVIMDNDIASLHGGCCAIRLKEGTAYDYAIVLHEEVFTLPADIRSAMIAHERGHIDCGHLDSRGLTLWFKNLLRSLKCKFGGVDHRELAADLYSIITCGAENTRKYLQFYIDNLPDDNRRREMVLRLRALNFHSPANDVGSSETLQAMFN